MLPTLIALLEVVLIVVAAVGLGACYRELRALRRGLAALDEGQERRTATVVIGLQALRGPLDSIRSGMDELSPQRRDTVEQRPPQMTARGEATGLRLEHPHPVVDSRDARDSDGDTQLMKQPTAAELVAACAVPPAADSGPIRTPDPAALAAAGLGRPRGERSTSPAPHRPPGKRTAMGLAPAGGAAPSSAPRPPPTSASVPARASSGTLMSMPAQVAPAPAAPSSGSAPRVVRRVLCRLCEGSGIVRARSGALDDCEGCAGSGYIEAPDERLAAQAGAGERRAQLPG